MKEGTAKAWRDNFLATVRERMRPAPGQALGPAAAFGTWTDFIAAFEAAFYSADVETEARYAL